MPKRAQQAQVRLREPDEAIDYRAPVLGEISEVDSQGRAWVTFPGRLVMPVRARSTLDAPAPPDAKPDDLEGAPVLLMFENGDPDRPIIVGLVRDSLRPEPVRPEVTLKMGKLKDVLVDGRKLTFDAKEEIVLRCGRSIVYLTRTGKILIRGDEVISRARRSNRIKGGAVSIN